MSAAMPAILVQCPLNGGRTRETDLFEGLR